MMMLKRLTLTRMKLVGLSKLKWTTQAKQTLCSIPPNTKNTFLKVNN